MEHLKQDDEDKELLEKFQLLMASEPERKLLLFKNKKDVFYGKYRWHYEMLRRHFRKGLISKDDLIRLQQDALENYADTIAAAKALAVMVNEELLNCIKMFLDENKPS